jgi:N-acetylmuramoyl-L-alanine amidase
MTNFYDRGAIGLTAPNASRLALRTPEQISGQYGFTIHWTGSDGTLFRPDSFDRLRTIQNYHMNVLGYGDIAYEGAFDGDGNTFGLRDSRYVGAHALGTKRGGSIPNAWTNGIVFLEDNRRWTTGASTALAWWCDLFRLTHGRVPTIYAHEYWSLTECPGPYVVNVVRFVGGHV